ncbi:MAG: hypothetical protein P8I03_05005 [Thalassotalea sp.]|nr:hypothetical protein [Thalassotalea sp.]
MNLIGLGKPTAQLNVYIENIPPLEEYQSLAVCRPMQVGEIKMIADLTGNHWRKIFNVYAKIVFELRTPSYKSWQEFRDNALLQLHSNENLLFNLPIQTTLQNLLLENIPPENVTPENLPAENTTLKNISQNNISIIVGKTYATKLGLSQECHWLSTDFAINTEKKLLICPYFDYRQLSNIKITKLCQLIKSLSDTI